MKPKRSAAITEEQKKLMVEFLKTNTKLLSGKFDSTFTHKVAGERWTELSNLLNAIPGGANKEWKEWKRVWQDLRSRTKNNIAKTKKHMGGTGGGEACETILTGIEQDIADIIGVTAIEGHASINESNVEIQLSHTPQATQPIPEEVLGEFDEFCFQQMTTNTENELTAECATATQPTQNTPMRPETGSRKEPKRRYATKRLEKTITATTKLATVCEDKLLVKRTYYDKKLAILERDAAARERTAAAKERSAAARERSAAANERMAAALESFHFF